MQYCITNKEDLLEWVTYFKVLANLTGCFYYNTEYVLYKEIVLRDYTLEDGLKLFKQYLYDIMRDRCYLNNDIPSLPIMCDPFIFMDGTSLLFSDVLEVTAKYFNDKDEYCKQIVKLREKCVQRFKDWGIDIENN